MESTDILIEGLFEKKWFKNSQEEIRRFVENCEENGIKSFLNNINEENDFGDVLSLQKIWKTGRIFVTVFQIRSKENNQIVEIESLNWLEGQNPLSRGIILIEKSNKVTHVLVEKKFNLVTWRQENKSFGIAYPEFTNGKLIKFPNKISSAIPNYRIMKFWDLGYVFADDSLIAGKTDIFAASVNVDNIEEIDTDKVIIYETGKIDELIESSGDSYLLAVISRLKSKKII